MDRAETAVTELGRRRERVGGASKECVREAAVLLVVVVVKWRGAVIGQLSIEGDCEEYDEDEKEESDT